MELNSFMVGLGSYRFYSEVGKENNINYLNTSKSSPEGILKGRSQENQKNASNLYHDEEEDVVLSEEDDIKIVAKNNEIFDEDDVIISDEDQNAPLEHSDSLYIKQSHYKTSYVVEEDDVVLSDEEESLSSFYIKPSLPGNCPPSQQPSTASKKASSKQNDKEIKKKLKKEIEKEVVAFLQPYIAREITSGNETGAKMRLMPLLAEKFAGNNQKKIQKIALEAYAKAGAAGFIKHLLMQQCSRARTHKAYLRLMFSPKSINLRPLREALEEGVKKDFPKAKHSRNQIDSLVGSSFEKALQEFQQIEKSNVSNLNKLKNRAVKF